MGALLDGRKVVAAAGTAERLSQASVAVVSVTITAETDNTGLVVVGSPNSVVAALATRRGHPLAAGDSITLSRAEDGVDDLMNIGLDTTVNGDGVTWVAGTV